MNTPWPPPSKALEVGSVESGVLAGSPEGSRTTVPWPASGSGLRGSGRRCGWREAALTHEGAGVHVPAAEGPEGFAGILRVAHGQNFLPQALGDGLVPGTLGFQECLPGVRRQCVAPEVGVVAGVVAAHGAREDVAELGD